MIHLIMKVTFNKLGQDSALVKKKRELEPAEPAGYLREPCD